MSRQTSDSDLLAELRRHRRCRKKLQELYESVNGCLDVNAGNLLTVTASLNPHFWLAWVKTSGGYTEVKLENKPPFSRQGILLHKFDSQREEIWIHDPRGDRFYSIGVDDIESVV